MTPAEMAQAAMPKLQALAEGKALEYQAQISREWRTLDELQFASIRMVSFADPSVRIKPDPPKPREVWFVEYEDGQLSASYGPSEDEIVRATPANKEIVRAVRFVEDMSGRDHIEWDGIK